MKRRQPKHYYHFTGDTLRGGKPIPPIGEWLRVDGDIVPCDWGLHASEHPFDARQWAPGAMLHKVELGDVIVTHGDPVDKVASNARKIVATIDATDLLRRFARRVALDVLPLWKDAPAIVREYLETGDEAKRAAAMDAARVAAMDAARAAAMDAARAAASAAFEAAASATAWDAAWAAASAAAMETALVKYRQWFLEMVEAEFAKGETTK